MLEATEEPAPSLAAPQSAEPEPAAATLGAAPAAEGAEAADPAVEAAQAAAVAVEHAAAAVRAAEQLAAEEQAAAPVAGEEPGDDQPADGASAHDEDSDAGSRGVLGRIKEKVGTTAQVVQQKVSESERVQQGVHFVKRKTTELAESDRVQKIGEYAKDTAKVVSEKTQQGVEFAKEKAKSAKAAGGSAWERGRGSVQKAKANLGELTWRGSARATLDMESRKEEWQNIKVQGAEELSVPARTEHTCAFHVANGSTLRWTFRVKEHDIGFGVRMRIQEWGGAREEEVLATERYDSADTISGSWVADEDRTIVLAFDNRYSKLRSKTVAYFVGTEKPATAAQPSEAVATSPAAE